MVQGDADPENVVWKFNFGTLSAESDLEVWYAHPFFSSEKISSWWWQVWHFLFFLFTLPHMTVNNPY